MDRCMLSRISYIQTNSQISPISILSIYIYIYIYVYITPPLIRQTHRLSKYFCPRTIQKNNKEFEQTLHKTLINPAGGGEEGEGDLKGMIFTPVWTHFGAPLGLIVGTIYGAVCGFIVGSILISFLGAFVETIVGSFRGLILGSCWISFLGYV